MAERNQEVGGNVISKSLTDEDGEFIWEEVSLILGLIVGGTHGGL